MDPDSAVPLRAAGSRLELFALGTYCLIVKVVNDNISSSPDAWFQSVFISSC